MSSLETLRAFLGWCTAINLGLLVLASIALTLMHGTVGRIHGKMFKLDETEVSRQYFQYLAQFKIAVLVFNFTPYIALRLMA